MDEEADRPRPSNPDLKPGDKLEGRSVDELQAFIQRLKMEIARVEAEIAGRKQHLAAAEALFKKP